MRLLVAMEYTCEDDAMRYAFKYGVLVGAIESAIRDLDAIRDDKR